MSRRYQSAILTASYNGLQVPNAPTIGTATAGAGSASVTFTAPSNVGGSAITSYTVISSPGSITGTGASSPITVSGLTNGTAYTFTVVATNAYGSGPASAASNSVTPQANVIENVFSTYLYTGNSTSQTITNGINLSGKGGLVWFKNRTAGSTGQMVYDTVRGAYNYLQANTTSSQSNGSPDGLSAFTTSGFSVNGSSDYWNLSGNNFVSWSFREQAKFFDVVTYTGNGSSQTISHNLGSTPGCIIIKSTSTAGTSWPVYHRGLATPNQDLLFLNQTASAFVAGYNNIVPSSTNFVVSLGDGDYNQSGRTYVAYLFAHDAGGFGLTGTDNVISCGSVTSDGSGSASVNLGWEPQWVLLKNATGAQYWYVVDNMRGLFAKFENGNALFPNSTSGETAGLGTSPWINSTGMEWNGSYNPLAASSTYIYIAIRRGPMKVPTSGTSVYNAVSRTGTGTAATITGIGFAPDLLDNQRTSAGSYTGFFDRLRGAGKLLYRALDDAETTVANQTTQFNTTMDGFAVGSSTASDSGNSNTVPYIWHCYKRAPSVFDIVCYTGNGSTQNVNHNLGVAPELMIVKSRSLSGSDWWVYASPLTTPQNKYLRLQSTGGESTVSGLWGSSLPTSTTFGLGAFAPNSNGATFVAYLFATCAGVSKVGSYTGTGALQTVNCGFAAGSRFILIKRTDSTGDWYVYDSTRGITSGNDPYLLWNTTGAEVTGTDYINTASVGFQVTATAPAGLNASGGTYIFLAIA